MTNQKATNITWYEEAITSTDRERLLNLKGAVLWFTGLSASGKSTLANAVEQKLFELGQLTYILDGDNIRHGLNKDLGFSPDDREENIRRIGEVSKLFYDAGVIAMTAFISPYRKDRDQARALVAEGSFVEIFVKVSLEIAEQRDPKGLYKKARAGEIKDFTGISAPYEEPENAELIVDTGNLNLEESVQVVIDYLKKNEII